MRQREEPAISTHARQVTLSLVSHTNVGKTSLARTLLRRDVGEVRDQAHVTEVSEAYTLIETPGGEGSGTKAGASALMLWDTPGFGDSVRLLSRLRTHGKPIRWFLQQGWDRLTDRPLWCSQQAVLNVREHADLVLYLVNATEDPEEAGYVGHELDLLSWMDRPVVLLLNQAGEVGFERRLARERLELWRRYAERWPSVREVVALDAFSRCWVQEGLLLRRLIPWLPEGSREVMGELVTAWEKRNAEVLERSLDTLASYLADAARQRCELPQRRPSREQRRDAMQSLGEGLVETTEELMRSLLLAHGLEGDAAVEVERRLDAFAVERDQQIEPERGAMLGGVVSGALGGLLADIMAGGLTFGGGMMAGAILGALGGAGLARGYQWIKGDQLPAVGWSPSFLDQLTQQALLRYLAVAHFGRGRGEFREVQEPRQWGAAATQVLEEEREEWRLLWKELARGLGRRRLQELLGRALRRLLAAGYPEAGALLGVEAAIEEE